MYNHVIFVFLNFQMQNDFSCPRFKISILKQTSIMHIYVYICARNASQGSRFYLSTMRSVLRLAFSERGAHYTRKDSVVT